MAMATATATGQRRMFSARRFIGRDVFDTNGQHVGEIEDLILGVDTACARWAILSAGQVLGMGGHDHVIPIQTVSIESESGRLVLSFDTERLRNAPVYDKDNPPPWDEPQWMTSIYTFYGMQQGQGQGQAYQQQGYGQSYQQSGAQQQPYYQQGRQDTGGKAGYQQQIGGGQGQYLNQWQQSQRERDYQSRG